MRAMDSGTSIRVDDELLWRRDGTAFPVEYTSTAIVTDGVVQQPQRDACRRGSGCR